MPLLLPQAVDHTQGRQQSGRADNHDVAVERFLEQRRLGLQCSGKCCFNRHEQQNEIETVQAVQSLVILAGQAFDVIAQGQHVLLDGDLADAFVLCRHVLLIGRQANLGVDHHLLIAGQIDDHVRLKPLAVRAFEIDLGLVLAALLQPGVLKHPLQNQLAPVALGLLPLQGTGQVGGLVAQAQIQLLQALQLLGQGKALTRFGLIAFLDAFFKRLDAFLQRIEQLPQALLTGFGETLLTLIEDFPRQLGKLRTQLVSRALQVVEALLMAFLLLTQLGVERSGLRVQTAQFSFFAGTFDIPGVSGIARIVTLDLQQFDFTAYGGEVRLFGGIGLTQISNLIATRFKLRVQAILRQMRRSEALFQQRRLGLCGARPALELPGQYQ
ncbi:hypothetical protein D3C86_1302550 [compost metagenome]